MYTKIKKTMILFISLLLSFQTISATSISTQDTSNLKPGEVTQNKSAKWVDYGKGIAEISFDVEGVNAEEPLDVVLVYDNSGSMQMSTTGKYPESRWNYASVAAKTFAKELLKSDSNRIMLIPFSDTLIDGNSMHTKDYDFFENHEYLYDVNGNPDIERMQHVYYYYGEYKSGNIDEEQWRSIFQQAVGKPPEEMKEVNNTKNAIVPFTNDESQIVDAIDSLYPSHLGQTNYKIALDYTKEELRNSTASRKIVIMISDGKPTTGGDITAVTNDIKASGANIYTVGTGISDADAATLKAIASVENGASLYTSADPSELSSVLETLRKKLDRAASNAKIIDEINTDYFEYYTDETHKPTVNGIVIGDDEFQVSPNKDKITWCIGNITETKKTLRFFIKVNDRNLNDDIFNMDESLLNKEGLYSTNKDANLSYKKINSNEDVDTGHGMESPKLSVSTTSMKKTYYLSDADGNYILENGNKVVLDSEYSGNKALHVEYVITPDKSIKLNGKTYHIYKEDNTTLHKTFDETDVGKTAEYSYRFVEQINVTFEANGHGKFNNDQTSLRVLIDHDTMKVSSLPEILEVPEHFTFTGWNTDKNGNGENFTTATEVKDNITVYAQWKEDNQYTVIFQDDKGTELKRQNVYEGADANAPQSPTKEGYTFAGWDKDFTNVKSDLIVKAQFNANKYTVIFDGNNQTSGEMENQSFVYDEVKALTKNAYLKDHHTFTGWLYDGKLYQDEESVKNLIASANGEVTLVAQWKEDNQYTVIFQDDKGTELKRQNVYEGADANAPQSPTKEGYTFAGWDKDFTNVKSDLIVKAQFNANKYTVIFDGNNQTSGEMENQSFVYDEVKALTKNAYLKDHHTFTGWLYDGKLYQDEESVKNLIASANGEVTLVAQWKESNKYTVTFQDEDGTELKSEIVYEGESATAPKAPTKEGYTFAGWDKDFTNVKSDLIVKAQYNANKYTVIFDGNDQTSGEMENQSFVYDEEKALTKNAYIKDYHTFTGWLYDGKLYQDEESVKNLIASANGEVTLVAQWKEYNKYTVTFQDEDGTELKSEIVYEGESATAPKSPTKEGYTFAGWDKDFTNVKSDLIVKAQFNANKYTVIFDGNNQTSGEMENQSFVYDEVKALTKNAYLKDHHTFTGWLYDGKLYQDEESVKNLIASANGEVTLVAQWKENNKYTVTFQDEDGTELKSEIVYEGESATAPKAPTKEGYTFAGWDKDFTNVKSDLIVKAQFNANKYTVIFDGNDQTSGEMENQSFVYDEEKALSKNAYIKDYHTFIGWLYDGKIYQNQETVKNLIASANGEVTLVAQWKESNKYTVTFQDEDGTELKSEIVYEGESAIAPKAPTKEGYTFAGWDKDFTNVKSDLIVKAQYNANKYTVIFDGNDQTSGEMENQSFVYDEEKALTKNAYLKDHHTFTGWLYDGKIYQDEESVKNLIASANGEVTFVAQWKENNKYTVTFQDEDGTELKSEIVYEGESAIAPQNPTKEGFTFAGWDKDFTNVKSDLLVTAIWEENDTDTPTLPEPPITPDTPDTPTTPEVPTAPITPVVPVNPVIPVTPVAPITPIVPITPVIPNTPDVDPVEPDLPNPDVPEDVETEEVPDNETPKANLDSAWALINLICSVLTVLLAIVILLGKHSKEEEDEDQTTTFKRRRWTKVASVVVGLVSAFTFILTEDITLSMMWIDKWTILMVVILIVQVAVLLLAKKWKKDEEMVTEQA